MKKPLDPEEERWNRKYPRFPGVAKCVELLRSSSVRGTWVDIICVELQKHAHDNSVELIDVTRAEIERGSEVAKVLLHVVTDSKLSDAFALFADLLRSADTSLRSYAVDGLKQLGTKEARRLLWQHGVGEKRGRESFPGESPGSVCS